MHVPIDKIQIIALANVDSPDSRAEYRRICRWYSTKFYTPLHVVEEDLPIQYVLTHYYETVFSEKRDDPESAVDYENIKKAVIYKETGEIDANEEADDEWAAQVARELAELAEKEAKKPNLNDIQDMPNLDEEINLTSKGE
jgi:hypothetical protein